MGDKSKSINYDERISNLRSLYNKYSFSDQEYISDKLAETININFSNTDISLNTKNVKNDDSIKTYLIDPVYMNILSIISELKDYRALEKVLHTDESNKIDPQKKANNLPPLGPSVPYTPSSYKNGELIPGKYHAGYSTPSGYIKGYYSPSYYTPGKFVDNTPPTQLYSGNVITNDIDTGFKTENKMLNADFNTQFDNQLARNRIDRVKEEQERLKFLIDNVTPDDLSSNKSIKYFHEMTMAEVIDNFANSIVILFKQVYSLDFDGLMKSQNNYIYYGFIMIFIYIVLRLTWQDLNG
jgi:hypothetical protein